LKCPRCQQENPLGQKFCGDCGARLALACASCGASNPPGQKFCGECGAGLASETAGKSASPEAYTPKHLAEKILTSKSALEGERKQVTVLFADLKGSMELLADRDPEEARKILDPVLELMMDAVHRYEGTVNQVMGDGIMALFGAPLAHEDHAVRACYAALRMQESVAQYAEGVFRSHGVPIQIRIGLNSGEVVVRAIGSDLHMDYTAVGQTTHLAARMEQMATPGTILLAPATLQLAEGYVHVTARGPVAVKGLPAAVEIYALTGASAQRTRLHAAAARGLTRFVGRDTELEQIRRALALAHDGHGQLVALVGEPGVGKSRLVYEFTHSHRTQDWLILQAGSVSYGKATSYLPVIDVLKAYFKVHDRESHREICEKVTGKLLTLDRALEPILPALLALLDMPVEDAHWQALDPAERRQRTLDAVKHLLLRESQGQPILVVVEDLHWIDAETQALLDSVVESLPTARVLLLVNYRPEYQHGWGRKTYYSQLRLDALPPESAGELLTALLGDGPGLEPLKRLLVRRGNPFFIEESIRTLVETGTLAGERGTYRLTRPIQAIEVPATVQVILAARIDRLPADDKQLLQTASVIGKDVPLLLLHAVAEAAENPVQRGLTHLQAAEFLYETRLFPDPEYTFKHALTHEVTYGTLLQDRRKALHARIADAIERFYPDRLSENVERLAHHTVRGELWEKALKYGLQAGNKAMQRSAHREAAVALEGVIAAAKHLPETPDILARVIEIRLALRSALTPLGETRQALQHLREAEVLAERLGDQPWLGRIASLLAGNYFFEGDPASAIAAGLRALDIGGRLGDVAIEGVGGYQLGRTYFWLGELSRADGLLTRTAELLVGERERERFSTSAYLAVENLCQLAETLAERGEFHRGHDAAQRANQIAREVNHPFSMVFASYGLGRLFLRWGRITDAISALEENCHPERGGMSVLHSTSSAYLSLAYALAARRGDAMALFIEPWAVKSVSGEAPRPMYLWAVPLLEGLVRTGSIDRAAILAERALAYAREHQMRGNEAWARYLLGEIASERQPSEFKSAGIHYRDSVVLAEPRGMRPLVAHCHLGLGKLYWRTDKREQAREHLATATTMYRDMGMTYWLEKVEAEAK
jgi:class 3 adenylate cyclase/tetratricopeptide (TPR) repeat protein